MLWIILAQPSIGISQINELEDVGMSFGKTHTAKITTIRCWCLDKLCELQCTDCTVFEWPLGTVWEEYICLEIFYVSIVTQLFSKSYPSFSFKHFFFYFLFSFVISKQSCFLTFVYVALCLSNCEIGCGSYLIYLSFSPYFSLPFFASFLPSKFINNLFFVRHYETHHIPRGRWCVWKMQTIFIPGL